MASASALSTALMVDLSSRQAYALQGPGPGIVAELATRLLAEFKVRLNSRARCKYDPL